MSSQVNFNGNHPYNNGAKSGFRDETVDVKSLPSNGWGLYEMHGNVMEWCDDWFDAYPSESVKDPMGAKIGSNRVLRGGSWLGSGMDCRSAFRYRADPDARYVNIGIRLARCQRATGL